ncbi:uncharacterized protein LOC127836670 isoform X2 [Dreissena polymorpha]|uniref:uncharacterized protein LOC127836670 isoform X2 n=1 Tax=Dreissena polymorpha TaxID=45954 RepID=UPI00226523D9|nr:uncharacterized protein LOC127836670 isoform X2 [Dreissena polymorpha]
MECKHYFIAMLMVASTCITGVSLCSSSLTRDNNAINLETNVTLKCTVCPDSSGITFKHNGTEIAADAFGDTTVTNNTLHDAYVKTLSNGSKEMTLIIFNYKQSSNGNYTCYPTSSTNVASLTLAYTAPTTPGSADGKLSIGAIIGIVIGCIALHWLALEHSS